MEETGKTVIFGKRPIDGLPRFENRFDDWLNTESIHEQTFFRTPDGKLKNRGYFKGEGNRVREDYDFPENIEDYTFHDSHGVRDLDHLFDLPGFGPGEYALFGNNCQSYCDTMKIPLIFVLFVIAGCNDVRMDLPGRLLTGAGGAILSLSLADRTFSHVADVPVLTVNEIDMIDTRYSLLSVESPERIAIYDDVSKTLNYILSGGEGVFLPHYERIVFYTPEGRLASSDMEGQSIEIVDHQPNLTPMSVVRVSESEVVYDSKRNGRYGLWKYSFETGQSTELTGLTDCEVVLENRTGC